MTKEDFNGDSYEYEMLTEAVDLSRDVEGLCCEVGLRLGRGMAEIINAVTPDRICLSIDPYGSILYHGREHMEPCRLDYTVDMRNVCVPMMYAFAADRGVRWHYVELTDDDYFDKYSDGLVVYDLERWVLNKYSMLHLDGPHSVAAVCKELDFFAPRMDKGATLIIDDITIDFLDISKVEEYMSGWFDLLRKGSKKGLWVRK